MFNSTDPIACPVLDVPRTAAPAHLVNALAPMTPHYPPPPQRQKDD